MHSRFSHVAGTTTTDLKNGIGKIGIGSVIGIGQINLTENMVTVQ
jgi:hypothetical protein